MSLASFDHLCSTFAENEKRFPDLMEPYSILLADGELSSDERTRIMRQGLRETIARRYPLPESQTVAAVDDRQGTLAL